MGKGRYIRQAKFGAQGWKLLRQALETQQAGNDDPPVRPADEIDLSRLSARPGMRQALEKLIEGHRPEIPMPVVAAIRANIFVVRDGAVIGVSHDGEGQQRPVEIRAQPAPRPLGRCMNRGRDPVGRLPDGQLRQETPDACARCVRRIRFQCPHDRDPGSLRDVDKDESVSFGDEHVLVGSSAKGPASRQGRNQTRSYHRDDRASSSCRLGWGHAGDVWFAGGLTSPARFGQFRSGSLAFGAQE